MKVAVAKETFPGERRVALVPADIGKLAKLGLEFAVETQAGEEAGFLDKTYEAAGATILNTRDELFAADMVLQVRCLGANPLAGRDDLARMRSGQFIIGSCDPLGAAESVREVAQTGASLFALELIPRITRAQSMDVLSSQATIAGYRAVLSAAVELPKIFPMLMTAAGTLTAARVFVLGVGVAGLQAIATAKRLGAVVQAHDIRPTSKTEAESVGAKFVELPLETDTQDKGGYAKALTEADYQRQRELIADVAADCDIIITTAAIPGRRSPLLVTKAAVDGMKPGSVIVDLAAERGGNCELTKADERTVVEGVVLLGPTNLPSDVPNHASQMLSGNVTKFLQNMVKDGQLDLNLEDEIIRDTLVAHNGDVCSVRIRDILGMEPLPEPEPEPAAAESSESASDEKGDS